MSRGYFYKETVRTVRMNAITEIKKKVRKGDRLELLPYANIEIYRKDAYKTNSIAGEVLDVYPAHVLINRGNWRESICWADMVTARARVIINGKVARG